MKLYQIIEAFEANKSVLIELIAPYKKALNIYFSSYYNCEPMLMVTSVMNAAQYAIVVPSNDFSEAVSEWLNDYDCSNEDSDNFPEYETICFNSIPLSKL